jgi:hypothetical protein
MSLILRLLRWLARRSRLNAAARVIRWVVINTPIEADARSDGECHVRDH